MGVKWIDGGQLVELCAALDRAGFVIQTLERHMGMYRVLGIVPERKAAEQELQGYKVARLQRREREQLFPRRRAGFRRADQLRLL